MPQPLSSREANLFRSVVRLYEEKQYKRGLKAADQILKKNPKHGDTMSMKALIMNAQNKTDEAFALAKEALTVDMKSHICWHVYGILYRTNKNFDEAIKAYKFALRLEPDSFQIQRDLAVLQVQMRDYQGYIQSRLAMLKARPHLRQNWTALAIAYHFDGNLDQAEHILTTYEKSITNPVLRLDYENSEAVLYKNSIIAEKGDTERALDHLDSEAKRNLDRLAVMELRAEYLAKLGRKDDAAKAWRALLDRNPDHPAYYTGLMAAMDLNNGPEAEAHQKAVCDEYAAKAPRCDVARRLPLDFLSGDSFREAAKGYLTFMLNKGVPSTFANVKQLYGDAFKKDTFMAVAEEYLKELTGVQTGRDGDSGGAQANGDASKGRAAGLYFLAQHHNYYLSRDLDKAMEYIDKAIELGPKTVEYHMTKARIHKHRGDLAQAAKTMDYARELDTRDRCIASKAAKYQLRNDENDKALVTMGLFTRPDTPGGPLADLVDMQCIWFLTEDGEAWQRRGNVAMALKRFHTIFDIFDVWQEDQFDFHTFSLRKGQVRAYVDMIRWEDRLREHPFYTRAALNAIKIYLGMHDKSTGSKQKQHQQQQHQQHQNGSHGGVDAGDQNGEDAAEKKRAAKKAKKEAQKAEREAAEKAAKQDPNKIKESEEPRKKDDDPNGLRLAATSDPLGEAAKVVGPVLQLSPKNMDGQLAGFDVYMRKSKYVLALRCLKAALALEKDDPRVRQRSGEFRDKMEPTLATLAAKIQEVIKTEMPTTS